MPVRAKKGFIGGVFEGTQTPKICKEGFLWK
jgi:hypothetical protein